MIWADLESRIEADAARLFDEVSVTCRPRRNGLSPNHPDEDDPSRPVMAFMASLDANPPVLPQDPGGASGRPGASGARHDAVMTAAPDAAPLARRGDRIEADGATYAIADVHRDGTRRTILYLARTIRC